MNSPLNTLPAVLLIIALIAFLLGTVEFKNPPISPVRFVSAGLFLWLLGTLIQAGVK
jgi:hypothetical protein